MVEKVIRLLSQTFIEYMLPTGAVTLGLDENLPSAKQT